MAVLRMFSPVVRSVLVSHVPRTLVVCAKVMRMARDACRPARVAAIDCLRKDVPGIECILVGGRIEDFEDYGFVPHLAIIMDRLDPRYTVAFLTDETYGVRADVVVAVSPSNKKIIRGAAQICAPNLSVRITVPPEALP